MGDGQMEARYVRKGQRVYHFSACKLCGTAWGGYVGACPVATCTACGSPQCLSNGLANARCSICGYGWLPGWSGVRATQQRGCGYAECGREAVAAAPRVGRVCREHLGRPTLSLAGKKVTLEGYIADRLAARDQNWELRP